MSRRFVFSTLARLRLVRISMYTHEPINRLVLEFLLARLFE